MQKPIGSEALHHALGPALCARHQESLDVEGGAVRKERLPSRRIDDLPGYEV